MTPAPTTPTSRKWHRKARASSKRRATAPGDWKSSTFPSEDPYVICVGGTDLQTSSAAGPWSSETVWTDGGGGISTDQLRFLLIKNLRA